MIHDQCRVCGASRSPLVRYVYVNNPGLTLSRRTSWLWPAATGEHRPQSVSTMGDRRPVSARRIHIRTDSVRRHRAYSGRSLEQRLPGCRSEFLLPTAAIDVDAGQSEWSRRAAGGSRTVRVSVRVHDRRHISGQMKKVFPEFEAKVLPPEHPIFLPRLQVLLRGESFDGGEGTEQAQPTVPQSLLPRDRGRRWPKAG